MTSVGVQAEQLAAVFLQQQGLQLVEQNYRCRYGEIDLILREQKTLVFVEVRLRKNEQFGGAAASITTQKQTKLLSTARHYLSGNANPPSCRFDVVLLSSLDASKVEWIKNAFGE